jgi:hypothetical protein
MDMLRKTTKNLSEYAVSFPWTEPGSISAPVWDITQRWVVVHYRRFGSTYRSHLQGSRSPRRKLASWTSWSLKMRTICCLETSVMNYHSTLRNIPEEHRSDLHPSGSLKSYMTGFLQNTCLRVLPLSSPIQSCCSCLLVWQTSILSELHTAFVWNGTKCYST